MSGPPDKRGNDEGGERVGAPFEKSVARLLEPFQDFVGTQSASGWVLLAATAAAVVAANSPWGDDYQALKHVELGFITAEAQLSLSLQLAVNEGLMALFFFLLGLELKREILVGRLSEPRRAASVLAAAVGGMLVPALVFVAVSGQPETREAWAIPMATDTAFALMLLLLLGDRAPAAARAFLVGLAIVDDLGAILVIAAVYSPSLDTTLLLPAAGMAALLLVLNLTGVRLGLVYLAGGVVLWALFLHVGLHGTLAGVVVALVAPVRPALSRRRFVEALRTGLRRFQNQQDGTSRSILEAPEQHQAADDVLKAAKDATVPLRRWESRLGGPVSMIVVPLFAFLNAGVALDPTALAQTGQSGLGQGILLGLLLGKPLGILLGVGMGRLAGIAHLPEGLDWRNLLGLGLLGGVGFTMSLFIGTLAFADTPELLTLAKQSIIVTSLLAGVAGYGWLRWCGR